ncbi:hypothetical protein PBR31_00007 [Xanthomonas phage PBR31]|uniref:Uncharacterized protein n=1 Tax=Xanthomonas phage PPDBI TaxID=2723911 RepID=A0A6H0X5M7_9CAUD|nr:hypothetical protein [Ralstonia pickettii]NYS09338.1 hypothetical protein [Ralstonia pickettii]QIN95318.1 hypothetical protein PBR31_00007 [Xanthomonas phage PBR31]QIW89366.1 hypothetical protein PPDBI_00007 [Xanthomonas phage PPDBI]
MSSPTQRSKALLESQGYRVEIVERYNSFVKRRFDLFGFIDLLAIKPGETVGVQTTSYSNLSARVKKIAEHENVDAVREAGWRILCHGWKKNAKGRWEVVVRDVS